MRIGIRSSIIKFEEGGEGVFYFIFITREEASMSRIQRPENSRPRGSAVIPIVQCIEEGGGASPGIG